MVALGCEREGSGCLFVQDIPESKSDGWGRCKTGARRKSDGRQTNFVGGQGREIVAIPRRLLIRDGDKGWIARLWVM